MIEIINTLQGNRTIPIPPGATFTIARRKLAYAVIPRCDQEGEEEILGNNLDKIRRADRLLQTAECVGGLACCHECAVLCAPCPISLSERALIAETVFAQPDVPGQPNERNVLLTHLSLIQSDLQRSAQFLNMVRDDSRESSPYFVRSGQ
jgi:hypothetical protein